MTTSTLLQITSNEFVQSVVDSVVETAKHHQFGVEVSEPESFSAPFSGDEYFKQDIQLLSTADSRSHSDFEDCLRDIEVLVEFGLSEGFVDSVT